MSQGIIYNIQRMSTEDGPGIRTTVFFKGCPLRCTWCSNPESQKHYPQLMFFQNLCTKCQQCTLVCPHNAITFVQDAICIDRELCQNCGLCVSVCPTKSREISGQMMSVEDVMRIVRKDALFYANSGGGVTLGGGEATAAGNFFLDVASAIVDEGYHITVDTCAHCSEEQFAKTISLTDLFLIDCKHMDPVQHKTLTGVDNKLILTNIQAALESRAKVRIRMPLIPTINDSEDNIAAMASFFQKFDHHEIEVMPYHTFGKSKYAALNKPYPSFESYTPASLKVTTDCFAKHGLHAIIV